MSAKTLVLIAALVYTAAGAVFSAVPPMINYQGKLMQPSGVPVPDGTYSMRFAIYDEPVPGSPPHAALWSETNPSVQVKGGLFSVLLGSVVNLPANIFDSPDRFFGVAVGSDPEMTPRQRIASVAYAEAAGNGVPTGGIIMWSGTVDQIPQGWALCDGSNGTPDLTGRFVVGVGAGEGVALRGGPYTVGATGGEKLHQLTIAEMPSHRHWKADDYATASRGTSITVPMLDPGSNPLYTGYQGDDQPHENRPPYYALCFIMKVGN